MTLKVSLRNTSEKEEGRAQRKGNDEPDEASEMTLFSDLEEEVEVEVLNVNLLVDDPSRYLDAEGEKIKGKRGESRSVTRRENGYSTRARSLSP